MKTKTIYIIDEPYLPNGLAYRLLTLEAEVSAKTVRVDPCRATGYRKQMPAHLVHFSAHAAVEAKDAEIRKLEEKAATMRAALEKLRESLGDGADG